VIVVDASCLVELLLQRSVSEEIASRLNSHAGQLCAPSLLDIEVAHVLRRYALLKELSAKRGDEAIEDLADFPIQRYPHTLLLKRIWDLRKNLTAYDAAYIALAEALDATLVTCDKKLANSTGHRARVELIQLD